MFGLMETNVLKSKSRLYFIDMARTIAILLMLEGHFVHDSLALEWASDSYPAYVVWKTIRGFTSPIFLTVTGLVFTYLLMGNEQVKFWQNIRVRRGLKRVVELLFWGYLLQYYAFHVLQCIAIGILTIISLYGIYRLVKVIPLWIYYFLAGTGLFLTYLFFGEMGENYWPKNAPTFIQNIFHGPKSLFPITPHMAYTMYGAMLGVLLFTFKTHVKSWPVILGTFALGLLVFLGIKPLLIWGSSWDLFHGMPLYKMDWLYEKFGMVLMVLSILLALETFVLKIKKDNLFLRIGQNTLSIYIIHMMVLYGSIIKIGVNDFLHQRLGPYELIPITLGFLTSFIIFVYYIDAIRKKLSFILLPMKKYTNLLFGIRT
jgi:uncharacterized membrane protein